MKTVTIGPATDEEREWAARLMSSSEPWITLRRDLDKCRKACTDPACLLFVARVNDSPLGFILLHPKGVAGSPYVRSIAVAPEARSRGIGRELLRFAEETFRHEARHIFLCVSSFNPKAKDLYLRCGYEIVGELVDYVISGASETLMIKRLVPE